MTVLSAGQQDLWDRFVTAYQTTRTRPVVDRFLHAILGRPR